MHRTIFNLADEPSFIDFFLFLWGQKEPKLGYRKKEAGRAAPGRWQKASSGDEGTQKAKKARVAHLPQKESEARVGLVAQWIVGQQNEMVVNRTK